MKIIVDTQQEKDELIQQSRYIHDFYIKIRGNRKRVIQWKGLDSDKAGILMHIYMCPDCIEVKEIL